MLSFGKIVSLALIASVKFLFSPFIAESPPYSLDFLPAFIITTSGGFAGIFVFTYFSNYIFSHWSRIKFYFRRIYMSKEKALHRMHKTGKRFSRTSRFIVWIKKRFGIAGVAFVTPCIVSIPIGCTAAVGLFRNRKKVLLYTSVSLLFWSLVLNVLAHFFGFSKYFVHAN